MCVFGEKKNKELVEVVPTSKYAVIEGQLTDYVLSTEVTQLALSVPYPSGFNGSNSIVISQELNESTSVLPNCFETNRNDQFIFCQHSEDTIGIFINRETALKDWSDYSYRVVLFKFKD